MAGECRAGRRLDERLAAAGISQACEPLAAWRRLRQAEGRRATVIDLYELAGRRRGLAAHELPVAERMRLTQTVMPLIWPGFTLTPGSERPAEAIEVVSYNPRWPHVFASWRDRIASALGSTALRIDHVGSTAVPGLSAKPIIDIQVSVANLADEPRYVPQLEAAGVQLRSRDELHRHFRPFPGHPRDVHVHVCPAGSAWEREHLLLRDYLRAHPGARDAYARAKRAAARIWRDDRWAYTEAKTEIILDFLQAAERRVGTS